MTAADLMTKPPVTIGPREPVSHARHVEGVVAVRDRLTYPRSAPARLPS